MTRHMRVIVGSLALVLSACANPYHDFYRPNSLVPPDARQMPGILPAEGPLKVFTTDDMSRDVRAMRQKGWFVIGSAAFSGGGKGVTDSNLRAQAEKVGAQAILVSSKYKDTVSGAMPLVLPNNSTSYTSGNATAYGPGGTVNAYGSATTTTYGTTTTMVPYSVDRFDYGAVFFIRMQQRLGLYPRPIDDAERQKLQTNSAVGVDFVVEGSPAFKADIFPGDLVLTVAGEAPSGPENFLNLVKNHQGQDADIVVQRGDQRITKHVHINAY